MKEAFAQTAETQVPANAVDDGQSEGPGFGDMAPMLILWGLVIYFLFLRPQKKKEQARKTLNENLKKKDQIVTIGGIHGRVESVLDDVVTVKVAENTNMKFSRSAIASVVGDESADKKDKKDKE